MKKYYVQIRAEYDYWIEIDTIDADDAVKQAEHKFIHDFNNDSFFGELDTWEVVDYGLVMEKEDEQH